MKYNDATEAKIDALRSSLDEVKEDVRELRADINSLRDVELSAIEKWNGTMPQFVGAGPMPFISVPQTK